jgi:hypothetical protein
MHHIGARQYGGQRRVDRVGRVTAQPRPGAQHPDAQPARLREHSAGVAERDQLAVNLPGEGPGKLQRIPLPATKQAIYAKAARS